MPMEERDYYAVLGLEPPSQQPEAADPAGSNIEGANGQGVAAPDGAENKTGQWAGETVASDARRYTGERAANDRPYGVAGETASSAAPRNYGAGDRGRQSAVPTGNEETDSSAEPRNDGEGERRKAGDRPNEGTEESSGGQSRAERAEQARLRREREYKAREDAAVRKALEERDALHEQELKGIFAAAGMTDRYNGGKAITTKEEFDAWQSRAQTERLARQLKEGSLTPESFQAAVNEAPAVKEAAALVERLKAREAQEKAQADKAAFDRQVAAELANIHKLDPGINSLEDVLNLPTGQEFRRLVETQGLSYEQAFKLANMDRILEARTQAAAQGAALQAGSKAHLRSVVQPGSVPLDVPREVVAGYRMLQPEMTMDEIRQDYAKRRNESG